MRKISRPGKKQNWRSKKRPRRLRSRSKVHVHPCARLITTRARAYACAFQLGAPVDAPKDEDINAIHCTFENRVDVPIDLCVPIGI